MDTNGDVRMLLLKDLCSRLPYGVIVKDRNGVHKLTSGNTEFADLFTGKVNIFPYLRPMSSMTEEEKEEYTNIDNRSYSCPKDYAHIPASDRIDWLLEHHFDFRGLIEKGLALEAHEGMYNV